VHQSMPYKATKLGNRPALFAIVASSATCLPVLEAANPPTYPSAAGPQDQAPSLMHCFFEPLSIWRLHWRGRQRRRAAAGAAAGTATCVSRVKGGEWHWVWVGLHVGAMQYQSATRRATGAGHGTGGGHGWGEWLGRQARQGAHGRRARHGGHGHRARHGGRARVGRAARAAGIAAALQRHCFSGIAVALLRRDRPAA
jgi:hypothetical protein